MNKNQTVFFIGKPGCGKGTQAKILAEKTGWTVLASGEQFRSIAKEETPVGRKVRAEIDQGLLAPHWFAMYLYLKSLFSVEEESGVIFDGFNRKEEEAELVIDSMAWLGRSFVAIQIAVSDDEIRRRLEGRKIALGRTDDSYVETRLEEYKTYTINALELFNSMGALVTIDGEQSPEKVSEEIQEILKLN
jgi:adenylate kinase